MKKGRMKSFDEILGGATYWRPLVGPKDRDKGDFRLVRWKIRHVALRVAEHLRYQKKQWFCAKTASSWERPPKRIGTKRLHREMIERRKNSFSSVMKRKAVNE